MEAQDQPGSTAAPADGPVPAPSLQPAPGPGSAAPRQDPAPSQPLYLKALTVPLYQPLQAGCWQPRGPLVTGRSCVHLESSNVPLILNPLLPSEGTDQPHSLFPKQLGQTLTLNIVSTLPVLSSPNSCVNASTGSLGKPKKAGKYVCKHCGRDCLKPSVLEKHIRSHTGERPFPCTTCGIAFKTQSNLYKHRRTQTHVNNTRAPPDSDSSSAAEQNGRSTESTGTHRGSKLRGGTGGDKGGQMEQVSSESSAATKRLPKDLPPPAASNPPFASENQEMANPSSSPKANQGVPEREPERLPSPGALPNGQCQRKKLREQRTPSANKHLQLQRQQATSWDKPWDSRPCESQLKKCESTDSGYLSRSDSAELASPGPLQGLGQPGTEPEGQPGLRSPARPEPAQRAAASVLEKKRLEEHISKLISHNKSVVDDTHLDNVRPRKTVLSKQGSIDLPMPYTYKDSFHFDIRTCDVNRKKNLSLCSAKSTFAPLEKCKPVFFHSVPTQFSTTIDTVPVTRSNSLPVAERDRAGGSQPPSLGRPPPNPPRAASLLPASDPPASSLDLPSSHPRALVRQAAVDDLPLGGAAEPPAPPEDLQGGHRPGAGAGTATRNKRDNQKKLKMFSHEKWQMYGDETFKKIYQKMKSSQNAKKTKQRGNKITDITSFTPDSKESVSSIEIPEQRDGRSSASDSVPPLLTTGLKPGTSETCANGDRAVQSLSPGDNADSFPCAMETSHPGNPPAQTVRSRTSPELGDSGTDKHRGDNSTSPAPGSCELGLKNPRCRLNASGRNDDHLPSESSEWGNPSPGEGSSACESESKSTSNADGSQSRSERTGQPALTPPGAHCNSTREAAGKSQNLPSERKKLKFEVEKAPDVIAKPCPSPSSEGRVGNEAEQVQVRCSSAQRVVTAPLAPRKAQEQKLSTGINESGGGSEHAEYMKTITLPTKALNYGDVNPLSHSAGISKASFVGFLGPEFRGSDCNSSALHNATDTDVKTCLVKTGAKAPLFDAVDVSSKIHHLQSGHSTPIPQQNAFPPKYILALPQDKRASDLSLSLRPEEQIPPCTPVTDTSASPPCSATSRALGSHPEDGAWSPAKPEVRQQATNGELRWSVDANWKTPVFCSPVNSETTRTLATADNTLNNQNFRQQDIIRDAWKNKRNKNELNYQRQAEEKWMSIAASSAQTPQKKTSFPSVYTSAFLVSAGERKGLHGPCSGCDSLTGTSVSSRAVEPAVLGWDGGGCPCVLAAPSPGLQDTHSSQRVAGSPASCCPSSSTFHRQALSTPCTASPTPPRSAPTCCSGGSTASSAKGTFPSLNAEPQLTWCCLTRSLPLPAQQPGSARSPLHPRHKADPPERALPKYDMAVVKMKNISRTAACGLTNWSLKTGGSSFPKGQQAQELNSAAPGGAFRNISEQRKKTVVCKKEKLSTNKLKRSHKQKKIKVTPKWYRGRLAHGHAQLKMNGLSKQHCFPNRALDAWKKGSLSQPCRVNRKCHSPQSKVQESYLHQQQATSCSTSDKPPCRRKKEGKNTSGISSHTENLNHVKQKHKMDKKFLQDISGQIREHTGTNFSFQNITAPLEIPVPAHSLSAPENAARQAASSEGGICCSGTLQPSLPGGSQPSVPRDSMAPSWPCPSDFMNTGRSDQPSSTASETTDSLRLQGSQENTLNWEPEGPGTLEPLTQVLGREKPPGEANTYPSLKDTSRPSSQPGRSHLFGSNTESAPGAELPRVEHTQQPNFSRATLDLQGSTDGKGGPWQEKSHGQPPATATAAFTKPPGTLRSPERESYSAPPSKAYKKRGLEMMRKQSRVEYDDTSSDDEDRLVIEI